MSEATVEIQTHALTLGATELSNLQKVSDPVVTAANDLVVEDQTTLDLAGAFLTEVIKGTLKQISESCNPVVKAANAAHKAATKQRNELEAPLKEAEKTVKGKIGTYLQKRQRIMAEASRKAEEERRQQAEEEQLELAAKLEAEGRNAEAERVLNGPPPQPTLPPPAAVEAPQTARGVSTRTVWKAEVVDLRELVADIAAGVAPLSLVKIDEGGLNRLAQSMGGQVRYRGVRVYQDQIVSARSR